MADRTVEAVTRTFQGSLDAIDLLLKNGLTQPALTLVYNTIDAMASLDREPNHKEVKRSDFVRWVDKYLLPSSGLDCAAIDLYSARCGQVHAFSASSKLVRTGEARSIAYVDGPASLDDLRLALAHTQRSEIVAVHVDTLVTALVAAMLRYAEEILPDHRRLELFHERARELYDYVPSKTMTDYLNAVRSCKET